MIIFASLFVCPFCVCYPYDTICNILFTERAGLTSFISNL